MTKTSPFQMIIGGLGGQGVLFVTRILADVAVRKGLPVLTTETHGMAQRGGSVVSHLKVGRFWSPMIRPSCADGLLALAAESAALFGMFLKPDGWAVINGGGPVPKVLDHRRVFWVDAEGLAVKLGSPKAANLVLLGYALGKVGPSPRKSGGGLFCSIQEVRSLMESPPGKAKKSGKAAVYALEAGFAEALRQGG